MDAALLREATDWRVAPSGRTFSGLIHGDSQEGAYLLEMLTPNEQSPSHPNLPEVAGTYDLDGRRFWVVNHPRGVPLSQILRTEGGAAEWALSRVRDLSVALPIVGEITGLPVNLCEHVFWADGRLVLDYLGALADVGTPRIPQANGHEPEVIATINLAAILHSCYTGKPASDPPYVFLDLSRFGVREEPEVQNLLSAGLNGQLSLSAFVNNIQAEQTRQRLVRLIPAPVKTVTPHTGPADPRSKRPTTEAADLALWVACMIGGLLVLSWSMG